jgi:hypothetical protein
MPMPPSIFKVRGVEIGWPILMAITVALALFWGR